MTANATLRSLDGLRRIWLEPSVFAQYYPVTFTSFWIEHQLWGTWAPGYHATNVLLHAANAVLAWRLLERLRVPGAWIAAALFAVHPVHVESVAWVTERKNVLSGVFYLGAALLFVARARAAYAGVVVLFALALLSKSVTATLPVALAIALWWRDGRLRAADVALLLALLALGAGAGALTAWMERTRVGAVGGYWDQTLAERVLIAGRALWFYAGKLLWPHPLVFNYPRWTIDARDWTQWAWPLGALAVAAGAWAMRARTGRGPLAALAFFAVTLAPALGFVSVYPMRYAFVADHFQYLASLGVLALAAAALVRAAPSGPRPWATGAAVPVLVVLAALTARQCFAYRDVETLWGDTLAKNPRSVLALQNLGTLEYARAMRANDRRRLETAGAFYRRALDVEPEQPDVWNSLGIVQSQSGRRDEARTSFETALRIDPRHAEAARNLGALLGAAGRRDDAIAAYERAVAAAPDMVEAREDLSLLLVEAGRVADAERHLSEAVRLAPGSLRAHLQLARVRMVQGRTKDAVAEYETSVQLAPRSFDAYRGLAEASAAAGDRGRAVVAAQRARDIALEEGRPGVAAELERRIAAYQSGGDVGGEPQ